jgi:hypothetical protein
LADYQLALRDFHREKGSLLNYNQVGMSEGAWPAPAYQDAYERGRFFAPRANPSDVDMPSPLSSGGFDPTQVGSMPSANYVTPVTPMASEIILSPDISPEKSSPEKQAIDSPANDLDLSVPAPKE